MFTSIPVEQLISLSSAAQRSSSSATHHQIRANKQPEGHIPERIAGSGVTEFDGGGRQGSDSK
jgi:hypothetical protein